MLADREDIEEFADAVRNALGDRVEEILLFGSYATGDYVPGSDVDIAVLVTEKEPGDERAVWDIADRFQADRGIRVAPKVFKRDAFEEKVSDGFSFHTTVREQGVTV
ncbi:MAG: nucleotidyltransferase domain-containing protein [Candidatus Nanohaloarchaea archaeon]|nr:nucleotidyltransferase domain-containing protein [Candidatus Nanohaloarchaea archaeon]